MTSAPPTAREPIARLARPARTAPGWFAAVMGTAILAVAGRGRPADRYRAMSARGRPGDTPPLMAEAGNSRAGRHCPQPGSKSFLRGRLAAITLADQAARNEAARSGMRQGASRGGLARPRAQVVCPDIMPESRRPALTGRHVCQERRRCRCTSLHGARSGRCVPML